jgi:CRISPR/Cas system-associated exonuclease Cas4 (RecB family)
METIKISPSSLSRLLYCPKALSAPAVFETSPAALKGIALHKQAERLLNGEDVENPDPRVVKYVTALREIPGTLHVEYRVENFADFFPATVKAGEKLGYEIRSAGYIDALILGEDEVSIVDLKTGKHKVEANCEQLLAYSIAINTLFEPKHILSIIFQPWANDHISVVEYTNSELKDLQEAVDETLAYNVEHMDQAVKGEHCRFCSLYDACHSSRSLL